MKQSKKISIQLSLMQSICITSNFFSITWIPHRIHICLCRGFRPDPTKLHHGWIFFFSLLFLLWRTNDSVTLFSPLNMETKQSSVFYWSNAPFLVEDCSMSRVKTNQILLWTSQTCFLLVNQTLLWLVKHHIFTALVNCRKATTLALHLLYSRINWLKD